MRRLLILALSVGPVSCGDDEDAGDADSGTSSASTTSPPTTTSDPDCAGVLPGCDNAVEVCEGGQCECQCADPVTSSADGSSSSSGGATSDASSTTTDDGESTAPASTSSDTGDGGAALHECVGLGAWQSCAIYCEAIGDSCIEAGCDGATLHYYNSAGECIDMENGSPDTQACTDPFDDSGQADFARCCCG